MRALEVSATIVAKRGEDGHPRAVDSPPVPLLECVPNVSEGRRAAVIERLLRAVRAPGVRVLDRSSDPDHNRTVLTLAGEAEALIPGLLRLYAAALEVIDLGAHHGVHPRVGAVDVVPFVPLEGATMGEAAAAARELGGAVAERFQVPVFLYEEAQERPWRKSLAEVRRGGVAGLLRRMAGEGERWRPDFGPMDLHPKAGASVIGARGFLIAFNAVLTTGDLAVARAIARRVRASNGGLPALRAIGVPLPSRGLSQVSMNLLDHRRTSLTAAFAAVAAEAARHGSEVLETELIGLLPAAAVPADRGASLRLRGGLPPERTIAGALARTEGFEEAAR